MADLSIRALLYNTHLFEGTAAAYKPAPPPTVYQDVDRANGIIAKLRASGADLVGLTEVWANDTKFGFIDALQSVYPYSYWDGNTDALQIGSGLLLLSKVPLSSVAVWQFSDLTGDDALSQKGYLTGILGTSPAVFVVLAHTQSGSSESDWSARMSNLAQMAKMIPHTRPSDVPTTLLMGDLNVNGEDASGQATPQYRALVAYFNSFSVSDVYRALHPDPSACPGYTYDAVEDELIDVFAPEDARSGVRQRLDYMFSSGLTPVASAPDSTTYTYEDSRTGGPMDLSDHYPVLSSFTCTGDP